MNQNKFSTLNKEELLKEKNKIQYNKVLNALLIGICLGITVYSAAKNGFTFFTFFPLILIYPFFKNAQNIKMLEEEFKSRY